VIANPATYASGFTAVNIAGDANWATFLANETSGLGNAKWGVFASAATNATLQVANGVQILTTASGNATSATTNSQLRGIVGAFGTTYLGGLQGAGTNFAVNDSYFATGGTNSGNWASGLADNLANKVAFNTDNAIGSTADFFRLTEPASGTNATISTLFSGATQWSFDGNTLSITGQTAPIPEPGTWAMLLAGLMMVGGIARRRMSI
jgi:hypothetical protein